MGKWGTRPWENDTAADWFRDFFRGIDVDARIDAALRDSDSPGRIRAACHLLVTLQQPMVWPGDHRRHQQHLALAITQLDSLLAPGSEFRDSWQDDPEALAQVERERQALMALQLPADPDDHASTGEQAPDTSATLTPSEEQAFPDGPDFDEQEPGTDPSALPLEERLELAEYGTSSQMAILARDPDERVRLVVADSAREPLLGQMSRDPSEAVRLAVVQRPRVSEETLEHLSHDPSVRVRQQVARLASTRASLAHLARDPAPVVRAACPVTSPEEPRPRAVLRRGDPRGRGSQPHDPGRHAHAPGQRPAASGTPGGGRQRGYSARGARHARRRGGAAP